MPRKTPVIGPHPFFADPSIGADHRGRLTCQTCRAVGVPGDQRHPETLPPPPAMPEAAARAQAAFDAARLGETGDDRDDA